MRQNVAYIIHHNQQTWESRYHTYVYQHTKHDTYNMLHTTYNIQYPTSNIQYDMRWFLHSLTFNSSLTCTIYNLSTISSLCNDTSHMYNTSIFHTYHMGKYCTWSVECTMDVGMEERIDGTNAKMRCMILHYITLHCVTWCHITWHDITLHYMTWHYIT